MILDHGPPKKALRHLHDSAHGREMPQTLFLSLSSPVCGAAVGFVHRRGAREPLVGGTEQATANCTRRAITKP